MKVNAKSAFFFFLQCFAQYLVFLNVTYVYVNTVSLNRFLISHELVHDKDVTLGNCPCD